MINKIQTTIFHQIHKAVDSSTCKISNHLKHQLLSHRKRPMSTATMLHHLNRQYSLNLSANTLFNRLRDDASKSNLSELTFKDMVEYSRSAQLFNHNHKNGIINGHSNKKNGINGTHSTHKNGHSQTTINNNTYLIESAEYVRKQLLIILARIIIDFQNLPYGVSNNPRIEQNMQSFVDSYTAIKQLSPIKSVQDKEIFHETLDRYFSTWTQSIVIPNLCLGLLEMAQQKHLQKIEECPYLSNFIDRIITRRFAARVLLGHYIALHDHDGWGIFEENCDVLSYIETAKNDAITVANRVYTDDKMSLPRITISDKRKSKTQSFVHCGKMIHQFTFELLKNSIRATMEFHGEDSGENDINIIIINSNDGDVTIKVGDKGGGISRSEMSKIFLYSYTAHRYTKKHRVDFKKNRDEMNAGIGNESQINLLEKILKIDKYSVTSNPYYIGTVMHDNIPMYGLGYGLPLVKAYTEYFGGWCNIHSVDGYGTDAYLFLPTLATSKSNVLSSD